MSGPKIHDAVCALTGKEYTLPCSACSIAEKARTDERMRLGREVLAYVDITRNWGTPEAKELHASLGESLTAGELVHFQMGMRWAVVHIIEGGDE